MEKTKLRHETCAVRLNKELCPTQRLGLEPGTVPCAGCGEYVEGEAPEAEAITVGEGLRRAALAFDYMREVKGTDGQMLLVLLLIQTMVESCLKTGKAPKPQARDERGYA